MRILKINRYSDMDQMEIMRELVNETIKIKESEANVARLKGMLTMQVGEVKRVNQCVIRYKNGYDRLSLDNDQLEEFLVKHGETLKNFKTKVTTYKPSISVETPNIIEQ